MILGHPDAPHKRHYQCPHKRGTRHNYRSRYWSTKFTARNASSSRSWERQARTLPDSLWRMDAACQHFDFGLLASRTVIEHLFCLKPSGLWFLMAAAGNILWPKLCCSKLLSPQQSGAWVFILQTHLSLQPLSSYFTPPPCSCRQPVRAPTDSDLPTWEKCAPLSP